MAKLVLWQKVALILVACMATAVAAPAQTFTTLHSFDGADGSYPRALTQGADGNFYGTTGDGGAYGVGTIFKITPDGTLTTLYSFCAQPHCPDGAVPNALMQATDGNFYGTTMWGGGSINCASSSDGCGTIFEITSGGKLTTLYDFCSQSGCTDGGYPSAGLIQATDGNLYGTTTLGGGEPNSCGSGCGTIFKITPGGTLTTLHKFDRTDGAYPYARLLQAADGDFYGTTLSGGTYGGIYGRGTVFKITRGGTLTSLYSFCRLHPCLDGKEPRAGLVQATDGNFYGATYGGSGTVFQITPAGALTTIHRFKPIDGGGPMGELIQASDGNFYGTAFAGGSYTDGTVFEITPAGTLGTLHSFDITGGAFPTAGLVRAPDGKFYGTTGGGGANNVGTIFRLDVAPAASLSATSLKFANQALDEASAPKTVRLTNSGTALLTISDIAVDGSSFAIAANNCGAVLLMGKTCSVSLTFTPAELGPGTGTLIFADNAADSPQKVSLSGMGVPQATLMPASATYAKHKVGTESAPKIFTLTNNQRVALNSILISTTGDFAVSATTCGTSLAAKKKCSISVTFTPSQTGTRMGQLSVSDSANNSPQTSNIKGTGQ